MLEIINNIYLTRGPIQTLKAVDAAVVKIEVNGNPLATICPAALGVGQCIYNHKIGLVRIIVPVEGFQQGFEVADDNVAFLPFVHSSQVGR